MRVLVAQSCLTLCGPMVYSFARLLCPWGSPGKNTGVGCHFLHQGIFPTQELNPGLLHCMQSLSCLSHQRRLYYKATVIKTVLIKTVRYWHKDRNQCRQWNKLESPEIYPCTYGQLSHAPMDNLGEGNDTPLQYSCLENPMDGGAW